jgi:maltokinase
VLQDDELAEKLAPLLDDFLPRQRWFGGDATGTSTITLLEVQRKSPLLAWVVVDTTTADGQVATYQLVVGGRPVDGDGAPTHKFLQGKERVTLGVVDGIVYYDALVDPELAIDVFSAVAPDESVEVARPLVVEQSNTSVVYDERLIMKFFRRLHAEPNPDVEVNRVLGERGFQHVVPQRAVLRRDGRDLAVVRDYLLASSDAWQMAQTSLRDLLNSRLAPDEAGADFGPEAVALGEVTGQLHSELAEAFGATPGDPAAWLEQARELLARSSDDLPRSGELDGAFARLLDVSEPGLAIRAHGDMHLGQFLLADTGWFVLDFEGEPARPVSERVRPASPLRDVSGMIRSFHYATQAVLRERGRDVDPDLRDLAGDWEQRASEAFWRGYIDVEGAVRLLPVEDDDRTSLLAAFELEKAIYEVGYELAHRPSWADIPASAIERLLDRLPAG